ncbi:uncharacterized protein LOC118755382 [Rhagoletis pomonella]|uniref:uncharacterized protein LOC118752514 n=1 Tax=Rhagoletis pomonella TaxID=28610 RepID=UPI001785E0B7|nr:uncharacterized protein LOC118752514 [Rhagoletis pomonella]XP_036346114.1 uncharacterized protein LOC118755382 [Rhagoletis pomonella]
MEVDEATDPHEAPTSFQDVASSRSPLNAFPDNAYSTGNILASRARKFALPYVADIITSPPADGKYAALKKRLISTFEETVEAKLRHLLRNTTYIEGNPSQFLQQLKNLASGKVPDEILRTIFMEQLPQNVRCILAISDSSDLDYFAVQADKVFAMPNNIMTIDKSANATQSSNKQTAIATSDFNDFKAEIQSLSSAVEQVKGEVKRYRSAKSESGLCYYHTRFGRQAKKCRQPCEYNKNNLN